MWISATRATMTLATVFMAVYFLFCSAPTLQHGVRREGATLSRKRASGKRCAAYELRWLSSVCF